MLFRSGHDLTKEFGDVTAVDGVSFSVGAREIFGFLGAPRDRARPAAPPQGALPRRTHARSRRPNAQRHLETRPAAISLSPLTYGVDAIRNVVFSHTMIGTGDLARPLIEVARQGGLVHHGLGFDVALMTMVAVVLAAAGRA